MIDQMLRAWGGERIVVDHDAATGAWMIIAIHSTVLGPAAGGTRMKPYPTIGAALEDALRLSEGMTYKFAAPGLPSGGGKAVVMTPPDLDPAERPGLLRRYGEMIRDLGGVFRTGPDVGTSPADMDVISETAGPYVFCRTLEAGGSGDPGPYTARGVFAAIEVACARLGRGVADSSVVVQGAGDVGGPLIDQLVAAGAAVTFSEITDALIVRYRDDKGVEFIAADEALRAECDVFAPCALGGILNSETIPRLRCKAIVGSANNQLGEPADAVRLQERGILYVPDFVANVGGAMAMTGIETLHWTPEDAGVKVETYVTHTIGKIFEMARADGITTDVAARRMAEAHLSEAE